MCESVSVRSGKINCSQVLLKFDEYYAPVVLTIMSTCTHNHEYPENRCTQLKYSSTPL